MTDTSLIRDTKEYRKTLAALCESLGEQISSAEDAERFTESPYAASRLARRVPILRGEAAPLVRRWRKQGGDKALVDALAGWATVSEDREYYRGEDLEALDDAIAYSATYRTLIRYMEEGGGAVQPLLEKLAARGGGDAALVHDLNLSARITPELRERLYDRFDRARDLARSFVKNTLYSDWKDARQALEALDSILEKAQA